MYDTRFKGSFKAIPIYVYKPRSIRKRTLGSISCITTTSRSLRPIPSQTEYLWSNSRTQTRHETIAPHWSSSYPEYLSPDQDQGEQRRVVWSRLHDHRANLANRLARTRDRYLEARRALNPRTTQAESSHDPLYRDKMDFKKKNSKCNYRGSSSRYVEIKLKGSSGILGEKQYEYNEGWS